MPHTHARLASLRKAEKATRDEIDQEVERVLAELGIKPIGQDTSGQQPPGRNVTGSAG